MRRCAFPEPILHVCEVQTMMVFQALRRPLAVMPVFVRLRIEDALKLSCEIVVVHIVTQRARSQSLTRPIRESPSNDRMRARRSLVTTEPVGSGGGVCSADSLVRLKHACISSLDH